MKKLNTTNKIIGIIIIAIIVIGIIMISTKGFNFGREYSENKRIDIKLGKQVELDEINQICKEVFEKEYTVQFIGEFRDSVAITIKDISEEQKTSLEQKINEKYSEAGSEEQTTETTTEEKNNTELVVVDVPSADIIDIIKPYIKPIIIATVIILIYMAIRYRKLGVMHSLVIPFVVIFLTQAIYFSIIAIGRIPIGILIMPIALILYIFTLILKNSK